MRLPASIAVIALFISACGASNRPADVVVVASGTDLESANPLVTIHPLSRQVQRHALFVTLVRYDTALALQPYFARRWSWSADRRALHVALFPDLRWHDGERTTARDVAFTIQMARDPGVGYARAGDLSSIENVATTNDTTITIQFQTPQRDVPAVFAELPIVPEHLLRNVAPGDLRRAAFSTAPIGNGPFVFVSRVPGQRWTFRRNDRFPEALGGPPRIRELVIAVVDEATTKFAGLASGDLDFAGISPTMAELAKRDPTIDVLDYPVLFTTALVFNTKRRPLDDVRVRQAIDWSIDRDRIVKAALAGFGTPAAGPVPPENPLAMSSQPAHDVRRADSLFDAAGLARASGGKRSLKLELLTVGSGDNAVEQLIQADLAERGIALEIRQLELAAFLSRARARDKQFDVLITGVPGDLSLSYLRSMFETSQSGSSLDYASFHTRALDAAFAAATSAASDAALKSAWFGVQRELQRQTPAVWLYHSRGLQGVSSRMRGVVMDLRGELASVTQWTVAEDHPHSIAGR